MRINYLIKNGEFRDEEKNNSLKSSKNRTKIFIPQECRNINQNSWTAGGGNADIETTKFRIL